ncbi:MAG: hypothetical protein QM493_01150 [Sulfurovum sp.]
MKKILLFSLIISMSVMLNAKPINNFEQILKIFKKKLRKKCGYTSSYLAQKHNKKEWEYIYTNKLFRDEFKKLCPKGVGILDDKMIESLFRFTYKYARGSEKHQDI